MAGKSKMKKNYFKLGGFTDTYRRLDKIHNYEYLKSKTPIEIEMLLISHLNDLGFEYEYKTQDSKGNEKIDHIRDYPYLTKQ
jgi:hypothetical protein